MYKALYCGICHTLGRRYGLAARLILSYDFVFLCSLLWPPEEAPRFEERRCPAGFRLYRCVCNENTATERASGYGVILAYHKLLDNAADEGLLKALLSRLAALSLRKAYRKAARDFPGYDAAARLHLDALGALETTGDAPPDAFADAFAKLLEDAATSEFDESRRRIFKTLLYHLGRWIYYADARDDLAGDTEKGRPNPLRTATIDDTALELTMRHSNSMATSAFELLDETAWREINRNILYLGLPDALSKVLSGKQIKRSGYRNL